MLLEENGVIIENGQSLGFVVDTKPDLQVGKIEENLFVASQDVANDEELIRKYKITSVLNVSGVPSQKIASVEYLDVSVLDLPEEPLCSHFPVCFKFIDDALKNGRVLVHCNAGISRSVSIVIAYLMSRRQQSLREALRLVKSVRPRANPNEGFMKQLKMYETICQEVN